MSPSVLNIVQKNFYGTLEIKKFELFNGNCNRH